MSTGDDGIRVRIADVDLITKALRKAADPFALNENGHLRRLLTGEIREHERMRDLADRLERAVVEAALRRTA